MVSRGEAVVASGLAPSLKKPVRKMLGKWQDMSDSIAARDRRLLYFPPNTHPARHHYVNDLSVQLPV